MATRECAQRLYWPSPIAAANISLTQRMATATADAPRLAQTAALRTAGPTPGAHIRSVVAAGGTGRKGEREAERAGASFEQNLPFVLPLK